MKGIIIEGDYVITCDKEDNIIENGAVYVENDRIKAIGNQREINSYYPASEVISGDDKILLPGLINTHTHSVQTLLRGKADDLALLDWLNQVVIPGEASFSAEDVYLSCMVGFAEMIRNGTTTCNDMLTTHHSDEGIKAAIEIGIRARIGKMLMDVEIENPDGLAQKTEEALKDTIQNLEKYHKIKNDRIRYSLNPRFLLSCSERMMNELRSIQQNYDDLLIHTHASENQKECKEVEKTFGKSYIRALQDMGILGNKTILAHGIWLDEEEYKIIQNTNTRITHNPSSNCKLASGICDVTKYQKMNVVVGLATDGPPCNNNFDMFREMRLATFLQKVKYLDEKALPAKRILRMATIEGAKAINWENEIGSLEVGKKADMIQVDINKLNAMPFYNPISHLIYAANGTDVVLTMIDGKIIYQNGKFNNINLNDIKEKIKKYQKSR